MVKLTSLPPVEIGRALKNMIPNAALFIIPEATHLAHEEFPDNFILLIEKQINKLNKKVKNEVFTGSDKLHHYS